MSLRTLLDDLWDTLNACWPGQSRWQMAGNSAQVSATRVVDVLGEPYTVVVEPTRHHGWAIACSAADGERLRLEYPEAQMGLAVLKQAISRVNELRNCKSPLQAMEMASTIRGEQLELLRQLLRVQHDDCDEYDDGGDSTMRRRIAAKAFSSR